LLPNIYWHKKSQKPEGILGKIYLVEMIGTRLH